MDKINIDVREKRIPLVEDLGKRTNNATLAHHGAVRLRTHNVAAENRFFHVANAVVMF
jgi:hypothetical protein